MQGRHEYQPELFSQIDIESLIPKNHILRKVDKLLDLSFLREETAQFYSEGIGRPSIDPEVFVRMVLLEHLYNIPSDRQLCEEVGFNLAYRWFTRLSMKDQVPDHSSMTKVRDRLGEETYRKIFLGEAKYIHGMNRARYRGRMKVQIQVYMIATVQNLKRLANTVFGGLVTILLKLTKLDRLTIFSEDFFETLAILDQAP